MLAILESFSPLVIENDEFSGVVARQVMNYLITFSNVEYLIQDIEQYYRQRNALREARSKVFSSEWIEHLKSQGLISETYGELNWSGRGQPVKYDANAEKYIPLTFEETLGHSATAIVGSVLCRRIRLARNKIRCMRPVRRLEYIKEVELLQCVQLAHVVRVVGTYNYKKDLALLLYPAAPWNIDEFMYGMLDRTSPTNRLIWTQRLGRPPLDQGIANLLWLFDTCPRRYPQQEHKTHGYQPPKHANSASRCLPKDIQDLYRRLRHRRVLPICAGRIHRLPNIIHTCIRTPRSRPPGHPSI